MNEKAWPWFSVLITGVSVTTGCLLAGFWAWRCRVGWHGDLLLTQKRDETGRLIRPHVLIWECRRCQRPVSETAVVTNWRLQRELRFQKTSRRHGAQAHNRFG